MAESRLDFYVKRNKQDVRRRRIKVDLLLSGCRVGVYGGTKGLGAAGVADVKKSLEDKVLLLAFSPPTHLQEECITMPTSQTRR